MCSDNDLHIYSITNTCILRIFIEVQCFFTTIYIWADQLLHLNVQSHTTAAELWGLLVQAHQGLCGATGKTPQDQAVAVLLPEAEATPVQTGPAGGSSHPGHGSGCPQSSRYCVWSLVQRESVGTTTPDVCMRNHHDITVKSCRCGWGGRSLYLMSMKSLFTQSWEYWANWKRRNSFWTLIHGTHIL